MNPRAHNTAGLALIAALGLTAAPLDYGAITRGPRGPRRSTLTRSERDDRAAKRKAAKAQRRRNR